MSFFLIRIFFRNKILKIMKGGNIVMPLKPGPKPIAKSTGKPDQRRRDNKTTPGNTKELKPSKRK